MNESAREFGRHEYWRREHVQHEGAYDQEKKERFTAFLKEFDARHGLGDLLIDFGCGPTPLSRQFPDRARIEVDVSKKRTQEKPGIGLLEVAADVEDLFAADGAPSEAAERMRAFIEAAGAEKGTVIASDLLNYIDWKKVFANLDRILPAGWQVAINNRVNYGPEEALHAERPNSPEDMRSFFTHELGYELVEEGMLPAKPEENDPEPHVWLVYRKPKVEQE